MSGRKFTGWHMTGILVAFFGVVVSVNVFMARAAISTFGGTVVDNSYVASQKFNGWLDKAEAQKALGWTVSARLNANRLVLVTAETATPATVATLGVELVKVTSEVTSTPATVVSPAPPKSPTASSLVP